MSVASSLRVCIQALAGVQQAPFFVPPVIFATPTRCCIDHTLAARQPLPGTRSRVPPRRQHRQFGERRSIGDSQSLGVDVSSSGSRSKTLQPAQEMSTWTMRRSSLYARVRHARRSLATGSCTPPSGTTQDAQETENHDWRRTDLDAPCAGRLHWLSFRANGTRRENGIRCLSPILARGSRMHARRDSGNAVSTEKETSCHVSTAWCILWLPGTCQQSRVSFDQGAMNADQRHHLAAQRCGQAGLETRRYAR
jgi:hypothetical protein